MNPIELIKKVKKSGRTLIEDSKYYFEARQISAEQKIIELRRAIVQYYVDKDIMRGEFSLLTEYTKKADEAMQTLDKNLNKNYAKLLKHKAEVSQCRKTA